MSSSIKLTNSSGKIVTITNPDTTSADVAVDLLNNAYTIATVDDFGTVPVGYTTVIVKDTDRGGVFNRIASTTANGGTIFDGTTGYSWERQYSGAVNVKWFGATGDGVTDDTIAFESAITTAGGKVLTIPKTDDYYKLTKGIAVYPDTTIEGNGSTIIFKYNSNQNWFVGFALSSGCTVRNINGYRTSNTFSANTSSPFINIGLFYAPTNSTRAYYADIIPDITDASSPDGEWDAPQNVIIENITSDISLLATTNSYGGSFIGMYNFVKNISIKNIKAIGFAEYINIATSWITTGKGVLNDNNYFDVVRFEWGHFVTGPTEIASGENIKVSNIYGKGLRVHNHSAVVSMGNAHSFIVENIVGQSTGQVFHCSSSGNSTSLDVSVLRTNATNRKAINLTGIDLYTWYDGHYCAGVNIGGSWEADSAMSPFNSIIVENVNITGIYDSTITTTYKNPEYGVLIGDNSWSGTDVRNVILKNINASKFRIGLFLNNCKNVTVDSGSLFFNGSSGLSIAGSYPYIAKNINISNMYIFKNNTDGLTDYATNHGSGFAVYNGDNIKVSNCTFGDTDDAEGNETQLNSVFLRQGQIGYIKFQDCLFSNYKSGATYDIASNSSSTYPIVRDCRSVFTTDEVPKVMNVRQGYNTAVVASGKFTAAPSTVTLTASNNISLATYAAVGRYAFTFSNALPDASYYVMVTPSGATTPEFFPVNYYSNNTASTFELYVKDGVGNNVDPTVVCQFVVLYIKPLASLI